MGAPSYSLIHGPATTADILIDLRCPSTSVRGQCNRLIAQVRRPTFGTVVAWCPRCKVRWTFVVEAST